MKKYAAAGAAAVMVFGVTAFAASFDVDDSVLATGTGDVDTCTDDVAIYSWEANRDGQATSVYVQLDEDCYTGDLLIFGDVEGSASGDKLPGGFIAPTNIPDAAPSDFPGVANTLKLDTSGPVDIANVFNVRFTIHTGQI